MLSGGILFLTWAAFTFVYVQFSCFPKKIIPAISFASSQVFLFFFYLALIPLGQAPTARYFLITYIVLIASVLVIRSSIRKIFFNTISDFIFPKVPALFPGELNLSLKNYVKRFSSLRILITSIALVSLLIVSISIETPQTWDAHTYNLSRIALMIFKSSIFLPASPSLPQAIFPLGHDLLYYPDIAFGNLKGLALVSTLEFAVILGLLFNICDLIRKQDNQDDAKPTLMLEISKLLAACLFISSDQQTLQAASTKNDLVILMIFTMSCLLALTFLKKSEKFRFPNFLSCSIFMAIYGFTWKTYGIVTIFPFLATVLLLIPSITNLNLIRDSSKNIDHFWNKLKSSYYKPVGMQNLINARYFIDTLSLGLAIFVVFFNGFIQKYYSQLPEYQTSVSKYINNYSSPHLYIYAGIMNFSRFILNFALYPYSTILKIQANASNDYLIGLSPIVKLLSKNNFAVANGYKYGLLRYKHEDVSLTSPLVHIAIILAIVSLAYCLCNSGNHKYLKSIKSSISLKRISVIFISSLMSTLFICTIFSYHNWFAKYLGFFYVPMIPVLSWIIAFNFYEIQYFKNNFQSFEQIIKLKSLLNICKLVCLSSLILFALSLSLNTRFLSLSFIQPGRHPPANLYEEYLYSTGFVSAASRSELLKSLTAHPEEKLILCYGEETPTLVPFMELLSHNADPRNVDLLATNSNKCKLVRQLRKSERVIILP